MGLRNREINVALIRISFKTKKKEILQAMQKTTITTSSGSPIDDNQNSMTAGPRGPILAQDFHLLDKLAHFARERIPERVVHAKGAGAHGYVEISNEMTA